MSPSKQLRVLVLAAGAGRRLGRDKAALPWGRITLIEHVLSSFPANRVQKCVVVVNPANCESVRKLVSGRAEMAVNSEPKAEMISSIRVGIAALADRDGPLCVHPVDVFAITTDLVAMLHNAWLARPDMIHLPVVGDHGGHPLILPPFLVGEIERIPPGRGLNYLIREHADKVARHPWRDERLLADIDSPDDYARYAPPA